MLPHEALGRGLQNQPEQHNIKDKDQNTPSSVTFDLYTTCPRVSRSRLLITPSPRVFLDNDAMMQVKNTFSIGSTTTVIA